MKTESVQPNISKALYGKSPAITENYEFDQEPNFKNFTLPVPMTDPEIAPPLHVWDKIVRILDEQDNKKKFSNNAFSHFFQPQTFTQKPFDYTKIGLAFLISLVLVGIILVITSIF